MKHRLTASARRAASHSKIFVSRRPPLCSVNINPVAVELQSPPEEMTEMATYTPSHPWKRVAVVFVVIGPPIFEVILSTVWNFVWPSTGEPNLYGLELGFDILFSPGIILVYAIGAVPSFATGWVYAKIAARVKFWSRMISAILVSAIVYLIFSILFLEFLTKELDKFAWTVIGCGACAGVGSALLCALIEEGLAVEAIEASKSTIGK
jgi:hypothetical protein